MDSPPFRNLNICLLVLLLSCADTADKPSADTQTHDAASAAISNDLNTSPCQTNPCQNNGTCVPSDDGLTPQCKCKHTGYSGDFCSQDRDECKSDVPACDDLAKCTNTPGSYKCDCNDGYEGSGLPGECFNINECLNSEQNNCDTHAHCTDTMGSYTCSCADGYQGAGVTGQCSLAKCPKNSTGAPTCLCDPGYQGTLNFQSGHWQGECINIPDCLGTPCQNGGTCVDGLDTYSCECSKGYSGDHCETNVDDCINAQCNNGTCLDEIDSYSCVCQPGWSGITCDQDIDECAVNAEPVCDTKAQCTNQPGGYACQCQTGYVGSGKPEQCFNVNECLSPEANNCDVNAHCSDTVGSFECSCITGHLGTGLEGQCTLSPCPKNAGTAPNCACDAGYSGDLEFDPQKGWQGSCVNTNDCTPTSCYNGGSCIDGLGTYTCECPTGWSGFHCQTNVDDCESGPCQNNGVCIDEVNGYQCICKAGYVGEHCETPTCAVDSTLCPANSECVVSEQSYTCQCNSKDYTGPCYPVAIEALTPIAYEGGSVAAKIQLSIPQSISQDLNIELNISGSARQGEDYELKSDGTTLSNAVIIPAGKTHIQIEISPTPTPEMERDEWVNISVKSAGISQPAKASSMAVIRLVEYGPSPGATHYVAETGNDKNDGTKSAPFRTLQKALQTAAAGDIIYLFDGTYTNTGYSDMHGDAGDKNINNPVLASIDQKGSADTWTTIAAFPDGNSQRPLLKFDGAGGLFLKGGTSHVVIQGLEIAGPNQMIKADWAHEHRWSKESFYTGRGVYTWGPVDHIVIQDCVVHHAPGSAIRFNKADYILVQRNTASNSTWWSSSAESGIVIATAKSIDTQDVVKILYSGNLVYNNWNFMEFCEKSFANSTEAAYGNCDYYKGGIIDGQGLYVTRNNATYLHGRMRFENNIAFNNGFGGVVYHKTNRGELVNNLVFMNGAYPGLTNYTGMTLNTADDVYIANNIIWARDNTDFGLKNNGNASNVITTKNYIVGKSQFGSPTDNQIMSYNEAPQLAAFFKQVTDIAAYNPDPNAATGIQAPSNIDEALTNLNLDFHPMHQSTDFPFAQGTSTKAPPTDIDGVTRPSTSKPDIGPYQN